MTYTDPRGVTWTVKDEKAGAGAVIPPRALHLVTFTSPSGQQKIAGTRAPWRELSDDERRRAFSDARDAPESTT